jgi:hypothetical protein
MNDPEHQEWLHDRNVQKAESAKQLRTHDHAHRPIAASDEVTHNEPAPETEEEEDDDSEVTS